MKIRSKRFLFAILTGTTVGLLITIFTPPTCLGALAGIAVSIYLTKAETPKDGAIIGTIIMVPIGLCITILLNQQTRTTEQYGIIGSIPIFLLTTAFASGIGALFGLIIGFMVQKAKAKNWII